MNAEQIAQQIAAEHLAEKITLIYVDYRDGLNDDQIAALLADDTESLFESTIEWESDARWYGVKYQLDELKSVIADAAEEHDVDADDIEEVLREIIEDRDDSDPIKELMSHTSGVLVRYRLDEIGSDLEATLDTYGIDMDLPENRSALDEIEAESTPSDGTHGFYVLAYLDVEDALPGAKVTITNPNILALNSWSGSGWEGKFTGDITLTITPEDHWIMDADNAYGYGWTEVAGPVESYYTPDNITRTPITE